ncbi:putative holin-like toxin [Lysinibacillus sp. 54212]
MVTYEAMNLMFQFGMFLIAVITAIGTIVALFLSQKK